MVKVSTCPGPRAEEVQSALHGNNDTYRVDKFWVVVEARQDGKVVLQTRRGKRHVVDARSSRLRHPNLWERLKYRSRFPKLDQQPAGG